MTRALLSAGSNLGDRRAHLAGVVEGLGTLVEMVSPVYETPPWGDADQPAYLNLVILADDPATGPGEWLRKAQELEEQAGRVRDPERRFGPRTLDVDVIAVWDGGAPVFGADPELILPHPRAHLRAFVLRPWLDIDPEAVLPGHGPVRALLAEPALRADEHAMTPQVESAE